MNRSDRAHKASTEASTRRTVYLNQGSGGSVEGRLRRGGGGQHRGEERGERLRWAPVPYKMSNAPATRRRAY